MAPAGQAADRNKSEDKDRSSVYGAFLRGDSMSWQQLEVVAKDAGVSGNRLQELAIKDRAIRLIGRYHLPLEVADFSDGMLADEEFRLAKGSKPGWASIQFNREFWDKGAALYNNDVFLTYLLLRAQAYFYYRSHYDSEHCTWIVRETSEPLESSFQVLRSHLNDSDAQEESSAAPGDRDLEFRRRLDPSQDPVKTLKKLIEFALRCIAQKAADDWALMNYRRRVGEPPTLIANYVKARERGLASDFGRARFAMTLPERLAFHRVLKTPFRYAETQ